MRTAEKAALINSSRRWWLVSQTLWPILQVLIMRRMGTMMIMKIHSCAIWVRLSNTAGWCSQSPKWYSGTWSGIGRSRWSLKHWDKVDLRMWPTTCVKEIRGTEWPKWKFRQLLSRKRTLLQSNLHWKSLAIWWRLMISSQKYRKCCTVHHVREVVIWG